MTAEPLDDDAKVAAWITRHVGGMIERIDRQSRWTVAKAATLLDGPGYNQVAYLQRPFPRFSELLA